MCIKFKRSSNAFRYHQLLTSANICWLDSCVLNSSQIYTINLNMHHLLYSFGYKTRVIIHLHYMVYNHGREGTDITDGAKP